MTMKLYLKGGSSASSKKSLMVLTETDPEYYVKNNLNAVTANLTLNLGPEPIKAPLHQKLFSVLPIDIKSEWKNANKRIFENVRL